MNYYNMHFSNTLANGLSSSPTRTRSKIIARFPGTISERCKRGICIHETESETLSALSYEIKQFTRLSYMENIVHYCNMRV